MFLGSPYKYFSNDVTTEANAIRLLVVTDLSEAPYSVFFVFVFCLFVISDSHLLSYCSLPCQQQLHTLIFQNRVKLENTKQEMVFGSKPSATKRFVKLIFVWVDMDNFAAMVNSRVRKDLLMHVTSQRFTYMSSITCFVSGKGPIRYSHIELCQ